MVKNSESKITFLGCNARGFRGFVKQQEMLQHFDLFKPTIIAISDSRFCEESENLLRNSCKDYHVYCCNYLSNARGTMILIRKSAPIVVNDISRDDNGNRLTLNLKFYDKTIAVTAVYSPNLENVNFVKDTFANNFDNTDIFHVLLGDFNNAPNVEMDYNENYKTNRNPNTRIALNDAIDTYSCVDTFRHLNPDSKRYSWKGEGRDQEARLDLAFCSANMIPFLTSAEIKDSVRSDHDLTLTSFDFHKVARGPGCWKFDNAMLKDNDFCKRIETVIKECLAKYVCIGTYTNFLEQATMDQIERFMSLSANELQLCDYNINPNLLYEMLVNDMKLECRAYMKVSMKKANDEKKLLANRIGELKEKKRRSILSPVELIELEQKIIEYDRLLENLAKDIINRDKILSKIDGERPSKYFCNLEKDRSADKIMPELVTQDAQGVEHTLTKQNEIEAEMTKFYKKLYKSEKPTIDSIDNFLGNINTPKLSVDKAIEIEGKITVKEMKAVLDKSKNDSAPGMSGFTYEYYKRFWHLLGFFLVESANYSFESGVLPDCLSCGVITLLPKDGKCKKSLANWRPLMMLCIEYKLISGAIAERLGRVIGNLISTDQCGFVRGRFIGEVTRTVYDTMHYYKSKNLTGLLLLVDFRKAFDCIDHSFIFKCLTHFGFTDNFVSWIKLLVLNFKAVTNYVGNLSRPFLLGRGAKQGDPVSSLLFILSVEILALKIQNSINGLNIGNFYIKKALYADDLTIFLEYSEIELENAIAILEQFRMLSGLQINNDKTQCVVIGNVPNNRKLCPHLGLKWEQDFKLLGILFNGNLESMECNYEKTIEKVKKVIHNWRFRHLTVYGRTVIVKSLLLSKFANLLLALPDMSPVMIKDIEKLLFNFIWKGPDKVKRDDAKLPEKSGGLNLPNIVNAMCAMKLSWIRRAYHSPNASWLKILNVTLNEMERPTNVHDIVTNTSLDNIALLRIGNPFWSSCFKKLRIVTRAQLYCSPLDFMLDFNLWGARFTSTTGRTFNRTFFSNISDAILTVGDTLIVVNNRLTFIDDMYLSKPGDINIYKLASFRQMIRTLLSHHHIHFNTWVDEKKLYKPRTPIVLKIISMCNKGCGAWTRLLRNNMSKKGIYEREQKWDNIFGYRLGLNHWNRCYAETANINFSNKLRWFNYQLVRGCLKVNHIVCNFKDDVVDRCTFCNANGETILHLFFMCPTARTFIIECLTYLGTLGIATDFSSMRPYEFVIMQRGRKWTKETFIWFLFIKYHIWTNRCAKTTPTLRSFKNWLYSELNIIKQCGEIYKDMAFTRVVLNAIENENEQRNLLY